VKPSFLFVNICFEIINRDYENDKGHCFNVTGLMVKWFQAEINKYFYFMKIDKKPLYLGA